MLTRLIIPGEEDCDRFGSLLGTGTGGLVLRAEQPERTRDLETTAREFNEYFDSLTSLEQLEEKMRATDPDFDEHVNQASHDRYQELLAEVEAGRLSRLAAERINAGITQRDLSDRSGMRQANISRMEKPGHEMRVNSAKKLAAALGIDDYRILLP